MSAPAAPPDPRFDHLSSEQGLSQGTITAILQDQRGFLWVGTQEGLNRYDGYTFSHFHHRSFDPTSVASSSIRCLLEDRWGNLWIGTLGGGLDRFDPGTETFSHYRHSPDDLQSLSQDDVRSLAQDRDGNIWIATLEGGLNRMDAVTGAFEFFRHEPRDPTSLSSDQLSEVLVTQGGEIWVATRGNGLNRLDHDTGTFVRFTHDPENPRSLSEDQLTELLEDSAGRLWVGTQGMGLNRFDPQTGVFRRYSHDPGDSRSLSHDRVLGLYQDSAGRLWVGTAFGLSLFEPETDTFVSFHNDPSDPRSLVHDMVSAIRESRSGVVWVGTWGRGLSRWNAGSDFFAHHRHQPARPGSLVSNQVWAIAEDADRVLWVGTDNGLDRRDAADGGFRHYRYAPDSADGLDARLVLALHAGRKALWIGTDGGGLQRLDRGGSSFVRYRHDPEDPGSLSEDRVWSVLESRNGTVWVGTMGAGLNRLAPGARSFEVFRAGTEAHPGTLGGLSHDSISALAEDPRGALWVGTYGGGLNRLEPGSERFVAYHHNPDDPETLSDDRIGSLWIDPRGDLWIGTTSSGLNRFDRATERFRHWTEVDGLPANGVLGIEGDRQGRIWLGTNRGLVRFDPRTEEFVAFDVRDGLQSNEFNSGAHASGAGGMLYFGGANGFNEFLPENIRFNEHLPPVVFTAFKKYNRPVTLTRPIGMLDALDLSYRDDVISFEFAALDDRDPTANRYSYLLEGFDQDWVDLGTKRDVTFTNLDPGSYTLRVRGSNNDGVWDESGSSIHLHIKPPLWQVWWVRTLAVAAGIVLLALAVWGRLRRTEAQNRRLRLELEQRRQIATEREALIADLEASHSEMEQFTYTVSHDLKSPLVTIKGFLGLVEKDAARGDLDRVRQAVGRVGFAVETMSKLLSDLLEVSRAGRVPDQPEDISLSELAHHAAELVRGRAFERRVEITIPTDLPRVRVDRRRGLTVLQNLLDNAIKFAGGDAGPTVEVGGREEGSAVVCWVRDNGIGIDPRYHERVFGLFERLDARSEGTGVGLALAKRIIETRGGRIWVESRGEGTGTTFFFTLPRGGAEAASETAGVEVAPAAIAKTA